MKVIQKLAVIPSAMLIVFTMSCGGGGSSSPSPGALPAISGNYDITATSTLVTNTAFIGGNLQSDSAGHITGTVHVSDQSPCFDILTDVPVTGSVNTRGQISVATGAIANQVVNVTATVTPDGKAITGGSYSIAGSGCASGDHGTVSGFQVASFSGTYSGTLTSTGGSSTISGTLTQSSTADAHGLFPMTGTVTVAAVPPATSCGFTSAAITSSEVAGVFVGLTLLGNDGVSNITFAGLATDATGKTINGNFSITGGVCSGESGTGTLTH